MRENADKFDEKEIRICLEKYFDKNDINDLLNES